MEGKQILSLVGALILATLLVGGIALAQGARPQSFQGAAEAVTAAFTYQGQLDKNGSPVNDTCDMSFRLYDAASMGTEVGSDFHADVPVVGGFFTVNLDFGSSAFTGERRWLEVQVQCTGESAYTDLGRQELTAAPYALSLKPGAVISGSLASGAMLSARNSGSGYGVLGLSSSSFGVAGQSDSSYGVYAYSNSNYGMYAYGGVGDLRLYNGTIYADMWNGSDLALHSNDYVDVHLDDDDNSTSQFRVLSGADTAALTVDEAGSITSTADTQIVVSPLKGVVYVASNVEIRPIGGYIEVRASSTAGSPAIFVPVDLPSVLFGTSTKLKSIRVCYKCDNSASYISMTRVRHGTDSGGYTTLIESSTDRNSTTWECYTISDSAPGEIPGSLYVSFGMHFDGTGADHDIQIGNITLTLTEQ